MSTLVNIMGRYSRALAVDPTTKGFAWVVLEGSERLIDWGRAEVAGRSRRALVSHIIDKADFYEVSLGVVEDTGSSNRGPRARHAIRAIQDALEHHGVEVVSVSRDQVREMFKHSGSRKGEIAVAIGRWFPEIAPWVPPERKHWMDEDPRMALFDAASMGLTALRRREWGRNGN